MHAIIGTRNCRWSLAIAVVLAMAGCELATADSPAREFSAPSVRFELRGLKTTVDGSEYGTTYKHSATVVASGDSSAVRRPYLVVYRVERISGGDPENPRSPSEVYVAPVVGGIGDIEVYGGYRNKDARWDPEKVRFRPLGYMPLASPVDTTSQATP